MKRNGTMYKLLTGLVAAAVVAACADSSTGPVGTNGIRSSGYNVPAGGQASLISTVGSLLSSVLSPVTVVTRKTPLAQDVTASVVVTPKAGGALSIPSAGLLVVIPAGAVTSQMTITVTALKGNLVAYDFGPSGTKFAKPIQVTQTTSGTNISLLSSLLGHLHAAYFANDNQINYAKGTALVNELLTLNLGGLLGGTVEFDVSHFSGYLLANGGGDDGAQSDALRRGSGSGF